MHIFPAPVMIEREPGMKKRSLVILPGCVMALMMFSATAQAVSITHTWNFHTACYATGKCNDTLEPVGNVRTAPSDNALDVKVSAYAFTGGTGAAIDAWLAQYLNTNGGLGVTHASGDAHTIDNIGYADFVVFEFSAPVNVTGYYLNKFNQDADSTWYVGNLAAGFDFTGKTLAQLNALGLTTGANSWSSPGNTNPLETISTGVFGNYLILAASFAPTDKDDTFKIRSITAIQYTPDPVPEPGTILLVGTGLVALGWGARKQARRSSR
jgi:hypothetical protein